ncbi:tail protein [Bacillus phage vB_BanS_Sophrita]|uniref:Polymeric immunoglobulin receptor n=1 Tax=Bacillus phage vB_BanS_Sophrita TaxID=2894790 RepID=A0AAE8YU97_9CAUD|nr:tail protein [Bacillus phage vB_BanS_Sophrita]UGO50796.1 polymeric immunoglobulin receptor [Bacillus phage vB_BanS_Sophrita]
MANIVASGQITLVDVNDSKQLLMSIGSSRQRQVIFNPNNDSYIPNYATENNVLTPQLFIAGTNGDIAGTIEPANVRWYVQDGSTGTPVLIGSTDPNYTIATTKPVTLTIKANVLLAKNSMTYICEMDYFDLSTGFTTTARAEYEIVKITNGTDGTDGTNGTPSVMGILSNDSHSLPADSSGTVSNIATATTTMSVFIGTTNDSQNWTYTAVVTGCTGAFGTTTNKNVYTLATMTADVAYVDITAKKTNYPDIVKRFTITKNKSGASATTYWLVSSAVALSKNTSGAYVPATLTFTAKAQTGTGTPANYLGKFKIYESTDGTNFGTAKYTSPTGTGTPYDESSKVWTPTAGIKAVKVELYQGGGTTVLLDEQVIPVVSDGTNQISAVVWTPDGNTVKNSAGSLKVTCDLYNGSVIQTTGVTYKWFFQDPSASTDTGGGIGWTLIGAGNANGITGYDTNTITVPATAFVNVESYKCVATYLTLTYKDVATLIDVSDPYNVTIVGMNIFKNGVGQVTLTAKIYQGGIEVDPLNNQGFTYSWSLYDKNNNKVAGWSKNTKTITVDGADVTERGNVICEVSK